jgi:hypothetical protein
LLVDHISAIPNCRPLFYTDSNFQGLMPYYFHVLHPGRALELNWCVWNVNNEVIHDRSGECYAQQENCENCRERPIEDTGLIHLTTCQKPWHCNFHDSGAKIFDHKCNECHQRWFQTRSILEISLGRSGNGTGDYHSNQFFGYCHSSGNEGYQKMEIPPSKFNQSL